MRIEKNIETIVSTFQKGRELAESGISMDDLIEQLNETEVRFRSVAFEGASMGIALIHEFGTWKHFAQSNEKHTTQIHIGLGWALAQNQPQLPTPSVGQLTLAPTLSEIDPDLRVKVLDGVGYWNGLFQRRSTIRTQQIPENITPELQAGFDQGVGRAMWYITKGEALKVANIIAHFSEERRPDLWQGVGVASIYVGGCSGEQMTELRSTADVFRSNLEKGLEAAEESLRKTRS